MSRADRKRANGHTLEHHVGVVRQEQPILECAGLTLVRVADKVVLRARRLGTELPLLRGHESGAAPTPQVGQFHLLHQAGDTAGQRRGDGRAGWRALGQQDVGAPNVVVDPRPLRWPLAGGHARFDQPGHLLHPSAIEAGNDLRVVDQQGRTLVAQAGAGAEVDADSPVLTHPAAFDAQQSAELRHPVRAAQHAIRDVVAEEHPVFTDW
jgi:hypothetical protein